VNLTPSVPISHGILHDFDELPCGYQVELRYGVG